MTELRLSLRADLATDIGGQQVVAVSVGPQGDFLALSADEADAARIQERDEQPGWASFPLTRTRQPVSTTLLRYDGAGAHRTVISDLSIAFPHLQSLPGGDVLIVGARCKRFEDGTTERNARVYAVDGTLRRELVFGDGIEDVQATAAGDIWVSYFEEGVFGNYGWGSSEELPIGAAGLVCFDMLGNRLWEYSPPTGLGPIDDCYALNVAADAEWAYYYTDFPLVRIEPGSQIRAWTSGISGARALATDGRRVLLYGGYSPNPYRCVLGRLGETEIEHLQEVNLSFPDGRSLEHAEIVGRGPLLHVFAETGWYQLDIGDIPES